MHLHRIAFKASDLENMPERERIFVVLLGHISNEINILQKLIIMSHDFSDEPSPTETHGRTAQTMCLLRVLAGKLNEAHATIKKHYCNGKLESSIKGYIDEIATNSLRDFITYFADQNNALSTIRNKISFHNDWEFARRNLRSIPNDTPLFIYTDETVGNTLFHFADLGVAFMMSNSLDAGSFPEGLNRITSECIKLSKWFLSFSNACIPTMIGDHVKFTHDQLELQVGSNLQDVRIPFFMWPIGKEPT